MLFQTWTFGLFFLVFYLIYLGIKRTRAGHLWILVASYFFYAWWDRWYVVLIIYATLFDYLMLALMEKLGRRRKLCLALSIVNNLALLGFFKYGAFVTDNVNYLLSVLGTSYTMSMPGEMLPVGLSFYIFKSVAYVVDCYRGVLERERNLIRHAVFVSFFPILLAGPIERAANLLPQIKKLPRIRTQDICDGLCLFIVGLFKKVALADHLTQYVDRVYEAPADYKAPALILATFAFGWQIYFDFSGYTDMARGIGRIMGFRLMLNFNNPYLATGLSDFWRRWHISLSSWFRDYVYIPLGGNRAGKFNTYKNIFITMLVSGL